MAVSPSSIPRNVLRAFFSHGLCEYRTKSVYDSLPMCCSPCGVLNPSCVLSMGNQCVGSSPTSANLLTISLSVLFAASYISNSLLRLLFSPSVSALEDSDSKISSEPLFATTCTAVVMPSLWKRGTHLFGLRSCSCRSLLRMFGS